MKTDGRIPVLGVALAALLVLPALSGWAEAANAIVGNGNPASCDELALRNAILNPPGNSVSFNCGAAMVTIPLTQPIPITVSTTVWGAEHVTLQGRGPVRSSRWRRTSRSRSRRWIW